MAPLVQEVQSLIGEPDAAEHALQAAQRPLTHSPPQRRVRRLLGTRGGYGPVGGGGVARRVLGIGVRRGRGPAAARRTVPRYDLLLEVVSEETLERGDLYYRAKAAGRRRLHLDAARGRAAEVHWAVAFGDVVFLAGLLFYGDEGYGWGDARLLIDSERARGYLTAGGGVGVRVGRLGRIGAVPVDAL